MHGVFNNCLSAFFLHYDAALFFLLIFMAWRLCFFSWWSNPLCEKNAANSQPLEDLDPVKPGYAYWIHERCVTACTKVVNSLR